MVFETVEGDFSILADLDEVAVGITHVAAPFPAVRRFPSLLLRAEDLATSPSQRIVGMGFRVHRQLIAGRILPDG